MENKIEEAQSNAEALAHKSLTHKNQWKLDNVSQYDQVDSICMLNNESQHLIGHCTAAFFSAINPGQ